MRRKPFLVVNIALFLLVLSLIPGCISRQNYSDFTTATPLHSGHYLVIGFLGGRMKWDSPREGVRKLALELRAMNRQNLHLETVENVRRELALQLVERAFDSNKDGKLSDTEKQAARIILYGQSFGGAAVVKFSNQLNRLNIPVLLTIQIDSVGRNDGVIPDNVRSAANLFQRNGKIIRGEPSIRAQNPEKTKIIGNFQFDYSNRNIDLSDVPWHKKLLRADHSRMNLDPAVWSRVRDLILAEVK